MPVNGQVSDNDLEELAALFRLLSDKTRLGILRTIKEGERDVTSICKELKLPQPTVSHHLGILRMGNIVDARRKGKQVLYRMSGRTARDPAGFFNVNLETLTLRVVETAHSEHSHGGRKERSKKGSM
jgi:ArsR family transcriptional regulator, zinc-responsive transcriptional repressor